MTELSNGVEKRPNGCSCGGVHEADEPPRPSKVKPKRSWLQTAVDWKMLLATVFAPSVCAFLLWVAPSLVTKGELNVATTGISGQVRETEAKLNGKIDSLSASLSARVDGIEKISDRTQSGVEELLRRSAPPPQTEVVSIQASTRAAAPASPPTTPVRRAKKVEKKNDASLLGWIAR